jgi:hypothetical protein
MAMVLFGPCRESQFACLPACLLLFALILNLFCYSDFSTSAHLLSGSGASSSSRQRLGEAASFPLIQGIGGQVCKIRVFHGGLIPASFGSTYRPRIENTVKHPLLLML